MTSKRFERAPTIETERLRLRAHTLNDWDQSFGLWGNADVTRFIGGKPVSREETWKRLQVYAGMWVLFGYGFWAIEERETGCLVGEIGLMDARREMEPRFGDEPEIGWALAREAWGKGIASEALGAVLDWADDKLKPPAVVCIISPDNAPSIRLAGKFGFRERVRTTYHGVSTIQFERVRQDD
jgi:RimJ/RimL family protein N-acetyltransferase